MKSIHHIAILRALAGAVLAGVGLSFYLTLLFQLAHWLGAV